MDPTTDFNHRRLYELVRTAPRTFELVKDASWQDIADPNLLPHCYADPAARRYPIHTREATLLSAAYFWKYHPAAHDKSTDYIKENLEKAAALFNCRSELELVKREVCSQPQPEDSCFLIEYAGRKMFPITDQASLAKAAAYFMDNRQHIRYRFRREMAEKILAKQAELGAYLDDSVRQALLRSAGRGIYRKAEVVKLIKKYAAYAQTKPGRLTKTAQLVEEPLTKMAEDIAKRDELGKEERQKICETLDELDYHLGLLVKRSSYWPLPEDILFEITEDDIKSAAADLIGSRFTGKYYRRSQMHGLSPADIKSWLGPEGQEAVTHDEFVDIDSLHRLINKSASAAEKFDALVREVLGVDPVLEAAPAC